jgi:o-succinylbenzoate synthase
MHLPPFTLARITLREIRLPLVEPFRASHGVENDRRILLTHLEDTEGATAWGECVALSTADYMPETIDTAWAVIPEKIAPLLLGRDIRSPAVVHEILAPVSLGNFMACASLEMPCWALVAEKKGQSLAQFIGATRKQVAAGVALGLQDTSAALVAKVAEAIEEGYARIKIKIQPGADIEYLHAIRVAFGPELPLMVDANCAYSVDDLDHLKQLDEFGLMMIEQPVAWDDAGRHAQVQQALDTPICLDEFISTLDDVKAMHAQDSGRIVNIKSGRVGGLFHALRMHDYCQEHGIPVWCGGMLESGIGRAYNVALAAKEGFTLPGDLSPSRRYWAQDIVSPEWNIDTEGMVTVPMDRPCLGVDIDEERIDALTVRKQEIIV